MKPATRLVRFNAAPQDPFRPTATPIYQTATFEQESALEFGAYDYSRSGNPTRTVLEEQLAALEHAHRAFCFASGLAAISAVVYLLRPGDEIVAAADLYGGTCRLFSRILPRTGIRVRYVAGTDVEAFRAAITPQTRLVYIETPTNPLLQVYDLHAFADLAHGAGARLCVDGSMMSPYLQRPLDLGADIVIHSATKFLCGHADVTAGVVAVKDPALSEEIYLLQNGQGAVLGPMDSFLLLRGLKTLAIRLDRQQANAKRVAEFLAAHPRVNRVYWPGFASHPGSALHAAQSSGPGSVLSFETGSRELSGIIAEATQIFAITVSFGSIHSTISLPVSMSHASVPAELKQGRVLPEDLMRLSIGIEDAEDLIGDLEAAFAHAETRLETELGHLQIG
jgi:cysteine-S-conjugate beta-lyase